MSDKDKTKEQVTNEPVKLRRRSARLGSLAESCNGSIRVESELGRGTTFVVRLPLSEDGLTVNDMEAS